MSAINEANQGQSSSTTASVRNPSLHVPYSLAGQSDEIVGEIERPHIPSTSTMWLNESARHAVVRVIKVRAVREARNEEYPPVYPHSHTTLTRGRSWLTLRNEPDCRLDIVDLLSMTEYGYYN